MFERVGLGGEKVMRGPSPRFRVECGIVRFPLRAAGTQRDCPGVGEDLVSHRLQPRVVEAGRGGEPLAQGSEDVTSVEGGRVLGEPVRAKEVGEQPRGQGPLGESLQRK